MGRGAIEMCRSMKLIVKYKTTQGEHGTQYYPEITCPVCGKKFSYAVSKTLRRCNQCGTSVSLRGD